MTPSRDPIRVIVPFADGEEANRENGRKSRRDERFNIWGRDGGKLEVVIVYVDDAEPCYRESERKSIERSFEDALGPHPSFIFVRLEWPGELRDLPNGIIDGEDSRRVQAHYGATPRHDECPKTREWWAHLADTHNFLIRLQDCQQPDGFEMMAMLRGQAQGLGGLFYVTSRPLVIHPHREVALRPQAKALHRDAPYMPFVLCEKSADALLDRWFGRRFLVSMVEVGQDTGHWVTIIFDRYHHADTQKAPHLYVLDPETTGRSERAECVIRVWRQVLREIGYPATFVAYVLPLTDRPAHWATGYVALFAGMQAMRGLSGDRIVTLLKGNVVERRTRHFIQPSPEDGRHPPAEIDDEKYIYIYGGNSDLRFRDWCIVVNHATRGADVSTSLSWVLHHLVACAVMELGIRGHASFEPTPLRRLQFNMEPLAADIEKWRPLRASDNLTVFGGFNPICPAFAAGRRFSADGIARIPSKGYDPRGHHLNPLRQTPACLPAPTEEERTPRKKYIQRTE